MPQHIGADFLNGDAWCIARDFSLSYRAFI